MITSLRPTKLNEFRGKPEIKENLTVYIKSCRIQKRPLDHCLFYGLPGTGKTTLAHIIANELQARIKIVQGSSIQHNIDIINLAMTLNEHDILFIDEIHAVNPMVVELLYSIMEDFVIDVTLGKDFNSKITRIKIPHFTLIGATTLLGKIPQALEERFGIVFNLKVYEVDTLIEILRDSMIKMQITLTDFELKKLAENSKGIPRNANRLIARVYDFRIYNPRISISNVLKKLSIIQNGLDIDDLHYLNALYKAKRSLGLKTISQMVNIESNTIETKIEPFLLSHSYIDKTSHGRIITTKGIEFVEKHADQLV